MNESDLRRILTPLVLEMFGLTDSPPPPPPPTEKKEVRREKPHPTFKSGTAPAPGRFQRESSAIPGRAKPLVGTTRSLRDTPRSGPGKQAALVNREATSQKVVRLPGESDRDFIQRRARIHKARRSGYAPPRTDRANPRDMMWEMGH